VDAKVTPKSNATKLLAIPQILSQREKAQLQVFLPTRLRLLRGAITGPVLLKCSNLQLSSLRNNTNRSFNCSKKTDGDKSVESPAKVASVDAGNSPSASLCSYGPGECIIDTGATHHITSSLASLATNNAAPGDSTSKVHLPNGNTVAVSHIGSTCILANQTISNVLHLPDFQVNLVSVSKLTKELKCMVAFFPDFCVFQDLYTGQVKGIGKEDHGLYILTRGPNQAPRKLVNSSMSSRSHSHSTSVAKSIVLPSLHCESADVWHKRLGHAPIDIIKRHKSLSALSSKDNSHCTVCPLAKHTKLPFPLSTTLSKGVFELLHCDIWGPYKVPTYNGKRFFVTVVDDYSRYTWVFLLASKADTIVVLRKFLTQVKNVFFTTVKTLRTDNGCEFLSHAFQSMLGELGIVHQTTCVYTPQQNGVAERKHRTILNVARSIRFQASIPLQY